MVISFFLIHRMLRIRGLGSVRIFKVNGHADEAMVRAGAVRGLDKLGNDGADESADFGRGRVPWRVTDARRNLSGVCSWWRPLVLVLHRFFIAFLGLWLIMMIVQVLFFILLSGLLVVLPRGGGLQCGIGPFYLDRRIFGLVPGSLLLPPPLLAGILRFGLSLLVCL